MRERLPLNVLERRDKTSLLPLMQRGLVEREAERVAVLARLERCIDRGFVSSSWLASQRRRSASWYTQHWQGWRVLALEDFLRGRIQRPRSNVDGFGCR